MELSRESPTRQVSLCPPSPDRMNPPRSQQAPSPTSENRDSGSRMATAPSLNAFPSAASYRRFARWAALGFRTTINPPFKVVHNGVG